MYQDCTCLACSLYFKLRLLRELGSVCGVVDQWTPYLGLSKICSPLCQYLPIFRIKKSHLWLILAGFGIHATPTDLTLSIWCLWFGPASCQSLVNFLQKYLSGRIFSIERPERLLNRVLISTKLFSGLLSCFLILAEFL